MKKSGLAIDAKGRAAVIALVACVFLGIAAAGVLFAQERGSNVLDPRFVGKSSGSSGQKWIGGNAGSPFMYPGRNCIGCHAAGEGPRFVSAGTVYAKFDEKDDDFGVEGATVQLTDSKGAVIKMVTNKAGNFMPGRGDSISVPFSAKVIYKGLERKMMSSQSAGNCMMCHTAKGANGAPGRIVVP